MISVSAAKKILNENIWRLSDEVLSVTNALGRITSKDISSQIDVPSFQNSAMDGYALCYQEGRTRYKITDSIQPGDLGSYSVKSGEAVRIFTGAPIPEGADTVIQQELVALLNGEIVVEDETLQKGSYIRLRGAQCKAGDVIVKSGSLITPGVVALLTSVGICSVNVYRQPKVKLIVTGNELVNAGTPLSGSKIYNSNEPAVLSYLHLLGITDVACIRAKDNLNELRGHVATALNNSDILILTGGISVGEYDFVYKALSDEGVQPLFYKIRQRPGKPMLVGKRKDTLIFALPGNPAAVVTCFNQYVKPCLQYMRGYENTFSVSATLPLAHHWEKKGTLANILKAVAQNGKVSILHGQDSFNLLPFADANAFALLYENDMVKKKGDLIDIFYW